MEPIDIVRQVLRDMIENESKTSRKTKKKLKHLWKGDRRISPSAIANLYGESQAALWVLKEALRCVERLVENTSPIPDEITDIQTPAYHMPQTTAVQPNPVNPSGQPEDPPDLIRQLNAEKVATIPYYECLPDPLTPPMPHAPNPPQQVSQDVELNPITEKEPVWWTGLTGLDDGIADALRDTFRPLFDDAKGDLDQTRRWYFLRERLASNIRNALHG